MDPKHPRPTPASLCALVRMSTWVREALEHLFVLKHHEKEVATRAEEPGTSIACPG